MAVFFQLLWTGTGNWHQIIYIQNKNRPLWKGIQQLLPCHICIFDLAGFRLHLIQYFLGSPFFSQDAGYKFQVIMARLPLSCALTAATGDALTPQLAEAKMAWLTPGILEVQEDAPADPVINRSRFGFCLNGFKWMRWPMSAHLVLSCMFITPQTKRGQWIFWLKYKRGS